MAQIANRKERFKKYFLVIFEYHHKGHLTLILWHEKSEKLYLCRGTILKCINNFNYFVLIYTSSLTPQEKYSIKIHQIGGT